MDYCIYFSCFSKKARHTHKFCIYFTSLHLTYCLRRIVICNLTDYSKKLKVYTNIIHKQVATNPSTNPIMLPIVDGIPEFSLLDSGTNSPDTM